ncbi:phosphocholine cytidylyltransferase family protein [Treponema rectale]|uniref:Choline kinase n=1 Tax=Treponema rectale TaxID=744512 RepID=A0A840SG69_9SPIR|nr:phosphocholine cytidylyltransferase family protein [Treponema rectale]MBB5218431.1 choline kinase [Treponema rectale]QOS39878.1 phosphocholine cytidylyltransferase family protein [Treponema rectale]
MQAMILAAGTGSRLRPLTNEVPKCMVKVNGVPMIERAIDALVAAGIKKLIIGLGYKSEVLKDFIRNTFDEKRLNGMQIEFGENPDYEKTNNIYSLYLLKDFFKADDTLLLESDLVYKPEIIKSLVENKEKNLAVVSHWEDWMDGTVTLLNDSDEITNFIVKKNQKQEDKNSYYKTVNIYKFSKEFTNTYYLPFLETFMNVFGKNSYYETCLKFIAETDPSLLKGFKIDQSVWYEVDNADDLKVAESRF